MATVKLINSSVPSAVIKRELGGNRVLGNIRGCVAAVKHINSPLYPLL